MSRYHRLRDQRKDGGIRMSLSIEANSAEEADALFEERWQQRTNPGPMTLRRSKPGMTVRNCYPSTTHEDRETVDNIREFLAKR